MAVADIIRRCRPVVAIAVAVVDGFVFRRDFLFVISVRCLVVAVGFVFC